MASVSNLDQDMKRLRMSRYTPAAANEVRFWIEQSLGEALPPSDLLQALKDGTVLCRLANLTLSPPIKYAQSNIPFMQMENISRFLQICESPPFNLPSHDRFLTVDLYESKDPTQVLQCLIAFSRVANSLFPNIFGTTIGPKRGNVVSPAHTGASNGYLFKPSPIVPPKPSSTPNLLSSPGSILYAGWSGGASQGNQGISFGSRRQITSKSPHIPSLAEKQKIRKEKEVQVLRDKEIAEQNERQRQLDLEREEERAKYEEQRLWEEETRRTQEQERQDLIRQKRELDRERERLQREEERQQQSVLPGSQLKGQYLSQYQADQKAKDRQVSYSDPVKVAERRIQELEQQLEEAKKREQQQYADSYSKPKPFTSTATSRFIQRPVSPPESNVSWSADDKEYLSVKRSHLNPQDSTPPLLTDEHQEPSVAFSRPLPVPTAAPTSFQNNIPSSTQIHDQQSISNQSSTPAPLIKNHTGGRLLPQPTSTTSAITPRPLPVPTAHSQPSSNFLSSYQQPHSTEHIESQPDLNSSSISPPISTTITPNSNNSTSDSIPNSNSNSKNSTSNPSSISKPKPFRKSLFSPNNFLERERERERERQREWEANQQELARAAAEREKYGEGSAVSDETAGTGPGPGQAWDVNQYGYLGGDSQSKESTGIGFGARRQIIGPRPRKG